MTAVQILEYSPNIKAAMSVHGDKLDVNTLRDLKDVNSLIQFLAVFDEDRKERYVELKELPDSDLYSFVMKIKNKNSDGKKFSRADEVVKKIALERLSEELDRRKNEKKAA